MMALLHWLASFVVLAEALNKLERTCPLARGLNCHARIVVILKSLAWLLLAFGAGVGLIAPLLLSLGWPGGHYQPWLQLERPTTADAAVMAGFAALIIRTRMKEG